MKKSKHSISSGEVLNVDVEDYLLHEEEGQEDIFEVIEIIKEELLEKVIPEPEEALTIEKAEKCLSVLGKIWNLTEGLEGFETDIMKCETSDGKLLDMEGFIYEYQYLHIEAVDMALTDIRIIPQHFIWLLSVDISGNRLTNVSASPLTKLPNLVSIKLNRNQITDPYLTPMKHLQNLGMNCNKIKSLHRIYHPNLLVLDLNWNKIQAINPTDCWKLINLKQLELRGNQLTTLSGLQYTNLEELYLAENQISKLKGLKYLPKLRRLHLRKNPLSDLSGFEEANQQLEYVNLRSCEIEVVDNLKQLQFLSGLRVLIVQSNPFYPSMEGLLNDKNVKHHAYDDEVRQKILSFLPQVVRINKRVVSSDEKKTAQNI